MSHVYLAAAAAVLAISLATLLIRRRHVDRALYSPELAWLRAISWFAFCVVVSLVVGVPEWLASSGWWPSSRPEAMQAWNAWFVIVSLHLLFGYLYFWPRGTSHHGRPMRPFWALVFGTLWGVCQSLLALSVVRLALMAADLNAGGNPMGRFIGVLALYVVFWGAWQGNYWDRYVSPSHNIREWNLRKVLVVHVPFLFATLFVLVAYDVPRLFIAWHSIALVSATWTMRFPSPFDSPTPAHDPRGVPAASLSAT